MKFENQVEHSIHLAQFEITKAFSANQRYDLAGIKKHLKQAEQIFWSIFDAIDDEIDRRMDEQDKANG